VDLLTRLLSTRWAVAPLAAFVLGACAPTAPAVLQPTPAAARTEITAAAMEARVRALAHDTMRGRETGMPGGVAAARHLAAEAERMGLRPAGDNGSFFAAVPLQRRFMDSEVQVTRPEGARTLTAEEILPVAGLGGLPSTSRTSGAGPVLYAGHMVDPGIGDRELTAAQLRGAVVLLRLTPTPGAPPGANPRLPLAALFGAQSVAAAVVIVVDEETEQFWDYAAELMAKGALELRRPREEGQGPPFFLVTAEAAERLIGRPLPQVASPATDLGTLRYTLGHRVVPVEGRNVVALLPGRDPRFAGQMVAIGAHFDHVGIGAPVDGDSIYNGADDNASGTSALLAIAARLTALPPGERPLRSVLFAWHDAEEAGLLGSEYFTDEPTVPRDSIIAHINMDMVGRNHPDSLMVVGSRRIASELGQIVEEVNRRQPRPFILDYTFDEPGHPERIYCRSDHYSYARYGIPITFFTTGLHENYHQPSDRPELIDYGKLARISAMVGDLVEELANRAARPRVDQVVPPLGAPCV
jgi:hypothetical protein